MNIRTKLHRWLVRKLPVVALGALTLLFTGCGPEEWIVWAPDGEHAIVDGRVVDRAGNLLGDPVEKHESLAAWLPDSRRVLVMRSVEAQSWEEYAALLGAERLAIVAQAGGEMVRLIAEYRGDLAELDGSPEFKIWKENLDARGGAFEAVVHWLDASRPGLLDPLMEASAKKEAAAAQKENGSADAAKPAPTAATVRAEIGAPQIHELHVRSAIASGASEDQLLLRSVDEMGLLAVSPNGREVAFVCAEAGDFRLYVMALEPGAQPVLVAVGAEFAAWSPDSQELAYSKSNIPRRIQKDKDGLSLGSIARRRVCTPDGAIIAEPEAGEDVAGLILPEYPARVAWLPDGRIVFAGAKFTLPATTQSLPNGLTLFALRLSPTPLVEQLIPDTVPARLTERVNYFTVSPDGKKIAVLGNAGAVSVLALDTRTFSTLQDAATQFTKKGNDDSMLVPAWRTADELTFLVPAGDPAGTPARAEVVIASLRGGKRAISKSWPDSAGLPRLEK